MLGSSKSQEAEFESSEEDVELSKGYLKSILRIYLSILSKDHFKRNCLDLCLVEVSTFFDSLNDWLCYIKVS